MSRTCIACPDPITDKWVTVSFHSADPSARLNGQTFTAHPGCIRLNVTSRDVPMPERVSDPVAEPNLVDVDYSSSMGEWVAWCRECNDDVAVKAVREDAELAAAGHLARRHAA